MAGEEETVGSPDAIPDEDVLGFDSGAEPPDFAKDTQALTRSQEKASGNKSKEESQAPPQGQTPPELDEEHPETTVEGQPPEAPKEEPSEAETEVEKFSFMGRDFESRDAAEQWVRSWNGQLRKSNEKITELTEALARSNAAIEELRRGEKPSEDPKKPEAPPEQIGRAHV